MYQTKEKETMQFTASLAGFLFQVSWPKENEMKDLPRQIKTLVLETLQGSIAQRGEQRIPLVARLNLIQCMCSSVQSLNKSTFLLSA